MPPSAQHAVSRDTRRRGSPPRDAYAYHGIDGGRYDGSDGTVEREAEEEEDDGILAAQWVGGSLLSFFLVLSFLPLCKTTFRDRLILYSSALYPPISTLLAPSLFSLPSLLL
jgi:hypothetical protein